MRICSGADTVFDMAPSALGPSLPDIDSPVRRSLDPVGTPRRSGSLASTANTMYNNNSVSNPAGSRAGSRMASHFPTDDASAANLWARYTQIKDTDVAKNTLLEVRFSSRTFAVFWERLKRRMSMHTVYFPRWVLTTRSCRK